MAKSGLKKATELAQGADDVPSDSIIAAATKRADAKRAREAEVKRARITPRAKQTHAVNNENVHDRNHTDRQLDDLHMIERDSEQQTSWRPPAQLDAPPPRPGYCNRWVALKQGSTEDAEHFEEMLEQGWRPLLRSKVRKVHELTASSHGKYSQYYVRRGLILCEIPEKIAIQAQRYYARQQEEMNRGVDRSMFKLQNHVMPLLAPQRTTRVATRARRGRLEVAGEDSMEGAD